MAKEQETVISVKNVDKIFRLPHERVTTVKSLFTNLAKGVGSKYYEEQQALKDISFDVKKGEFFGIVGRNGSGKSTLLKILAGIYQPTRGQIETKGRLVPFIELGVGFNPELTGKENVYLNGAMLGFSKEEVDERYQKIVDFAELEAFMDQKLKNYSSGMQVRLAFSVAIQADADILLIDEVLAVGDADFQRKCFDYFQQLKKLKTTVVFVSHDMAAIREFCEKAALIEKNELVEMGSSSKIAEAYDRMFLDEDLLENSADLQKKEQDRWGDGRAKFESVELSHKNLTPETDSLKITTEIVANKNCENLVVGTVIKAANGESVCGINTQEKNKNIQSLKKGERLTIEWEYPNIFSDGKFFVDVAIHGADGHSVADWWNDAQVFKAKRAVHTPYHISPDIKINF